MIESLVTLLGRQAAAARDVASLLQMMTMDVLDDDPTRLSEASDQLEQASSRLACLELARVLSLSTAGVSAAMTADELVEAMSGVPVERETLARTLAELREAVAHLTAAQSRALSTIAER